MQSLRGGQSHGEAEVLRAALVHIGRQKLGPKIREDLIAAGLQLVRKGMIGIEEGEYFLPPLVGVLNFVSATSQNQCVLDQLEVLRTMPTIADGPIPTDGGDIEHRYLLGFGFLLVYATSAVQCQAKSRELGQLIRPMIRGSGRRH